MIELPVTLTSTGGAVSFASPVPLGYTKNKGVYRLLVTAEGEWERLTIRCFWHLPGGTDPASSLVQDGAVDVPASVTAHPGTGCITFEGSDGSKTVTSADLRYRVGSNSGTEDGTMPEPGTPAWEQLVSETKANADAAEQAKNDAQAAAESVKTAAAKADESASAAAKSAQKAEAAQKATEQAEAAAAESIAGAKKEALSAISTGEQGALGAVQQAQTTATEAVQAAQTAAESAVNAAKTNAVQEVEAAAKPAQTAAAKAEEAAELSTQAGIAASNAADDAKRSAGIATGASGDSALNAENAQNSAQNAQQSATDAAESQSAAKASADAAAKSQQSAATDAKTAADAKVAAEGSADDAAAAAAAAGNAASAAEGSKQAAGASEEKAAVSERAAKESEQSAAKSAEAALESKNAAETSEENAAASAKKAQGVADSLPADYTTAVNEIAKLKTDKADKTKLDTMNQKVENITPDDSTVGEKPWSSKNIVDMLCPPLEESGNPVVCYPVAGYPLGVKAKWEPVQEGSGTPSPENIRPIKGKDSVTITRQEDNQVITLTLPETVYGGEVDAVIGDGKETMKYVILNDIKSWFSWGINAHNPAVTGFYTYRINDYDDINVKGICSHLAHDADTWGGRNTGIGFAAGGNSKYFMCSVPTSLLPDISAGHEVDSLKSYLTAQYAAGTPVQIAYKLATPIPFTARGAQPLSALAGANTVLTDADSVTVTGRADPIKRIADLKNKE